MVKQQYTIHSNTITQYQSSSHTFLHYCHTSFVLLHHIIKYNNNTYTVCLCSLLYTAHSTGQNMYQNECKCSSPRTTNVYHSQSSLTNNNNKQTTMVIIPNCINTQYLLNNNANKNNSYTLYHFITGICHYIYSHITTFSYLLRHFHAASSLPFLMFQPAIIRRFQVGLLYQPLSLVIGGLASHCCFSRQPANTAAVNTIILQSIILITRFWPQEYFHITCAQQWHISLHTASHTMSL